MTNEEKRLKKEYLETPRPMGVLRIHNTVDDRSMLLPSVNLTGTANKHRFQLEIGSHPHRQLQADWNRHGAGAFTFDVIDELTPSTTPGHDHRADLDDLVALWREKISETGTEFYD